MQIGDLPGIIVLHWGKSPKCAIGHKVLPSSERGLGRSLQCETTLGRVHRDADMNIWIRLEPGDDPDDRGNEEDDQSSYFCRTLEHLPQCETADRLPYTHATALPARQSFEEDRGHLPPPILLYDVFDGRPALSLAEHATGRKWKWRIMKGMDSR